MSFHEPKTNVIQSSEGWYIRLIPRRSGVISYSDGNKTIILDSEMLASTSEYEMVIYTKSIKNWDDSMPITELEKKEMISNIEQALDYKGYKADFA